MYEDAEPELQRILKLVETCPKPFQEKAFEVLLQGYVNSVTTDRRLPPARHDQPPPAPPLSPVPSWREIVPQEVLPRLHTMAQRIRVAPEKLVGLFDFSSDPFSFAALNVEGKSTRQRVLRVAMLVAARSYLATGKWSADWSEIKAMCTHQNCYDVNNFAATLTGEQGKQFKAVSSGTNVQLSAAGQKEAESLLAMLAGGPDAAEE